MATGVGKRSRVAEELSNCLASSISALPEELLLHIFSYFTSTGLVSTVCLVSKRWHLLGQSCVAILDYRVERFISSRKHLPKELENFLKFANQIEAESSIPIPVPIRVMKLQLNSRLEGKITEFDHLMKSLAKLKFTIASQHVLIEHSDDFFLNLSQKCPCIVELTLTNCTGCEYIDLPADRYNKLTKVWVHNSCSKYSLGCNYSELYKLQKIRIGAENLERFHLYYNGKNQIDLDIGQCRQLQSLHLHCENFPSRFHTTNIFSTFPHLKTLFICLNRPLNDALHMVSDQLESLTIWNKDDLLIPLDSCTPNLRSFTYVGGGIIKDFALMDASKIGETQIELSSSKTSNVDWFLKLRSCIAKFSKDTVLCLSIYEMAWSHLHNIEDLGIHLPCPIKKLKLYMCQSLPQKHCKSLLDGLLWTFRPKILEFGSNVDLKLVLLKELDDIVIQQDCCKPTLAHRCWRHFLKDFKIVRSTKRDEQKYFTILFTW